MGPHCHGSFTAPGGFVPSEGCVLRVLILVWSVPRKTRCETHISGLTAAPAQTHSLTAELWVPEGSKPWEWLPISPTPSIAGLKSWTLDLGKWLLFPPWTYCGLLPCCWPSILVSAPVRDTERLKYCYSPLHVAWPLLPLPLHLLYLRSPCKNLALCQLDSHIPSCWPPPSLDSHWALLVWVSAGHVIRPARHMSDSQIFGATVKSIIPHLWRVGSQSSRWPPKPKWFSQWLAWALHRQTCITVYGQHRDTVQDPPTEEPGCMSAEAHLCRTEKYGEKSFHARIWGFLSPPTGSEPHLPLFYLLRRPTSLLMIHTGSCWILFHKHST